jgi:hypothetical protein
MKIVISESQYKRLIEAKEEGKIIKFPSLEFFDKDPKIAWAIIQKIIERKGNPPYSVEGNLDLRNIPIQTLRSLISVGGYLDLRDTPIESLGNLQSVGGNLDLEYTPIKSLGSLQSVGGNLDLHRTPLSIYTREQIREMVNVGGKIYLY